MRTLLVPIDFSEVTKEVLRVVSEYALALNASVHLIHIVPADTDFVGYEVGPKELRDWRAQELHGDHQTLHECANTLRESGLEVTSLLLQGDIVDHILESIEKYNIDAVVLGSHGHGKLYKMLLGSVSEGVVRQAGCPIILVPASQRDA